MNKNEYFKGWYFKCCGRNQTIAFIPSLHYVGGEKSALLQIITDDKAVQLPFDRLKYREEPLKVGIGKCLFSEKGIKADIRTDALEVSGCLRFGKITPINYDIMGPFKYVPFMQCRHSVYSMSHRVNGKITVNGQQFEFNDDIGYIEGDCGVSFPSRYIWTQCCFAGGSLMLSAADIPILGFQFTGIISVVLLGGKEYRLATYLGAKLRHVGENTVVVSQGDYELFAKMLKKNPLPLSAPINGKMGRVIHESASCTAYYRFSYKNTVLCEFASDKASFEFEY